MSFAKTLADCEINNIATAVSSAFCSNSSPWCVLKEFTASASERTSSGNQRVRGDSGDVTVLRFRINLAQ